MFMLKKKGKKKKLAIYIGLRYVICTTILMCPVIFFFLKKINKIENAGHINIVVQLAYLYRII
jgi:hypothetical protein